MSAAGADMQVLELDVDPQGQDIQRRVHNIECADMQHASCAHCCPWCGL